MGETFSKSWGAARWGALSWSVSPRVCKVLGSILSTRGRKGVHYYAGENELSESPQLTVREVGSKEEATEGSRLEGEHTGDLWGPESILTESFSE